MHNKPIYPKKGAFKKFTYLLKYHFHFMMFSYVWFGVFICGLLAPEHRVTELGSEIITQGWHLSALSVVLILPWPVIYLFRFGLFKRS